MRDLPVELGRRQRRVVGVREADVEEERLLRLGLALDELHRRLGDVALDLPAILHGVRPHLLQIAVRFGFPDVRLGRGDGGLGHAGALHAVAIQGAIGGLEDADMVLVEALAGRPALLARAEMPLAGDAGGVALALEQLAQRHFAGLEGIRRAPDDDGAETQPLRIAPGHQRRARRRASRLHQVLRQPQALAGELVDARRRHAADLARAVGADVAVADVVGQHDDDVRFVLGIR